MSSLSSAIPHEPTLDLPGLVALDGRLFEARELLGLLSLFAVAGDAYFMIDTDRGRCSCPVGHHRQCGHAAAIQAAQEASQ